MSRESWITVARTVLYLVLSGCCLGVLLGLVYVVSDLAERGEQWDGVGIAVGIFILAISVPGAATCAALLRWARPRDSTS